MMAIWVILICIASLLSLLAFIVFCFPLHLWFESMYPDEKNQLFYRFSIGIGRLMFRIPFNRPKKKKKESKKKNKKIDYSYFYRLFKRLIRHIKLDELRVQMHIGTGDASKTAILTGSISSFFMAISQIYRTKNERSYHQVRIEPDFQKTVFFYQVNCILSIYFGHIVMAALRAIHRKKRG